MNDRPDWDTYFLGIATAVAARADCTRRKVGAVIVDTDRRILGTGYNGSPPGEPSCLKGECPRGKHYETVPANAGATACESDLCDCDDAPQRECACGNQWPCKYNAVPGSSYDTGTGACTSVHAEGNALLFARASVKGATLYCTDEPCDGCSRLIQAAGIARVVWPDGERSYARPMATNTVILLGDNQITGTLQDGRINTTADKPAAGAPRDDIDPAFTDSNRKRGPVDDPPICERVGCGHLFGLHYYSLTEDQKDKHGACSLGCGCQEPILTPKVRKP